MKKYFLAISCKGSEFMFKRSGCIAVPSASAEIIRDQLNKIRYKLSSDHEIWSIHENDQIYNFYIDYEIKSYKPGRNIRLYPYKEY